MHIASTKEVISNTRVYPLFFFMLVGQNGKVYSFEVKDVHLEHAKRNYQRWLKSQQAQGPSGWSDNVLFFNDDLANVAQYIREDVDAVSLE